MPLTYDQDSRLKALSPVLDEHAEWFGRVIRQIFYPEVKVDAALLVIPETFDNWANEAQREDPARAENIRRIRRLHDDLKQTAVFLIKDAGKGHKPEVKQFDTFVTLYDEFVVHVRRLERDLAVADTGMDALTGLRTPQVMHKDIERELERRARRGRPFCLALARIDHYEAMKANLNEQDYNRIMVAVSEIVKKCIRSFDDAYHLNNGEFLMCLKQTEMSGGTAGLNRLRKLLEEYAPYYTLNGKEMRITMSACVSEPQPGDLLDDLVTHMRNDLNRYDDAAEIVLEYFEVSPLQRFVTDMDNPDKKPH